jgi:hypothetical protein
MIEVVGALSCVEGETLGRSGGSGRVQMQQKIDDLVQKARTSSGLSECVLGIEMGEGSRAYRFGPGGRPFFIASRALACAAGD